MLWCQKFMLKPEKCWYITISGHDNLSPIMMIYVKIQEKASKTRAFITRRVTNFFIFYFLHKFLLWPDVIKCFWICHIFCARVKNVAQKTWNNWYIRFSSSELHNHRLFLKNEKWEFGRKTEKTEDLSCAKSTNNFHFLLFAQIWCDLMLANTFRFVISPGDIGVKNYY